MAEKPAPKGPPRPPPPRRPRELERIEAQIEAKELEVRELERRLAEDWANLDTAAAYRRSREELDALLASWERLLDQTTA